MYRVNDNVFLLTVAIFKLHNFHDKNTVDGLQSNMQVFISRLHEQVIGKV